jgi:hypothetical protein
VIIFLLSIAVIPIILIMNTTNANTEGVNTKSSSSSSSSERASSVGERNTDCPESSSKLLFRFNTNHTTDDDDDDDYKTPPAPSNRQFMRKMPTMNFFNPEQKTREKRDWLQSNKKNRKQEGAEEEKEDETRRAKKLSVDDDFDETDFDDDDDDDDDTKNDDDNKQHQKHRIRRRRRRKKHFTFEKFLVVGLHPEKTNFTAVAESHKEFKHAATNSSNINEQNHVRVSHPKHTPPHRGTVGETYEADILFSYPNAIKSTDAEEEDDNDNDNVNKNSAKTTANETLDLESIKNFCFPNGVEPKLVEKTPSMSKILEVAYGNAQKTHDSSSFVFRLAGGENGEEPLYGVCLHANEFVSQMPVICSSSLSASSSSLHNDSDTSNDDVENDGGKMNDNLKKYLVAAPRCYCFITKTPFFKTTFEVLRTVLTSEKLERLRRDENRLMKDLESAFARSAILTQTQTEEKFSKKESKDDDGNSISENEKKEATTSNDSLRVLESFYAESIPKLGDETGVFCGPATTIIESAEEIVDEKIKEKKRIIDQPIPFSRPKSTIDDPCFENKCISDSSGKISYAFDEEAMHIEPWAIAQLCRSLSIENIMAFIACALLEKQVVVFSPNLGQLSGVVLSLLALLRPLRPRGLFLPILPNSMTDFLEAPVPFIVGIQHKTNEIRHRTQHLTRINAYKDEIKIIGGIPATVPNWFELREKLRPIHQRIRLAAETQMFSSVLEPSEKTSQLCREFGECFRNHMRDEILGRVFSFTIAEVGNGEKVTVLLKDELVESYAGRDRMFMKHFSETQMFHSFADELCDNRV